VKQKPNQTLANHRRGKQSSEPIKNSKQILAADVCRREAIGSGFTSDWMTKWREFSSANPLTW